MITDISDNEKTARDVAEWILKELDPNIPTHFVRFHPDYKMRDTVRTPIPRLMRAREVAIEMGLEHVYLGNVYDTQWSNTYCNGCSAELVTRYGLNARNTGLDSKGHCSNCGRDAHFKLLPRNESTIPTINELPLDGLEVKSVDWHGDIRSAHAQLLNTSNETTSIYHRRRHADSHVEPWKVVNLLPGESYRFILAKGSTMELGPEVAIPAVVTSNLHEVFDRAHFPTVSIEEEGIQMNDISPLPIFSPRALPVVG